MVRVRVRGLTSEMVELDLASLTGSASRAQVANKFAQVTHVACSAKPASPKFHLHWTALQIQRLLDLRPLPPALGYIRIYNPRRTPSQSPSQ